ERGSGAPQDGHGAREVRGRHRRAVEGGVPVTGDGRADVHAGGGDVGLDQTVFAGTTRREGGDVARDVEGAHRVRAGVGTRRRRRLAAGAGVAGGPGAEHAGGGPGSGGLLVPVVDEARGGVAPRVVDDVRALR